MMSTLANRNFFYLWVGQLLSTVGEMILFVALPLYVYETTGSAAATGTLFIVQTAPQIIIGPLAGVFVDRWDRKWVMIASGLARAAVLCLLFVATRTDGWIGLVYGVAFLQATISRFFQPAMNAIIPTLVEEPNLVSANSLIALSGGIATMVGPPAGGALLQFLGIDNLLAVAIGTYLLSALFMVPIKEAATRTHSERVVRTDGMERWLAVWTELGAGLRLIRHKRVASAILAVTVLASTARGMVSVLLVVFVADILHGEGVEMGWVVAAQGAGGLLGALSSEWISRYLRPVQLLALGPGISGLIFIGIVNGRSLIPAIVGLTIAGVLIVYWSISQRTLLQSHIEDGFLGRVFGTIGTATSCFSLVGMVVATALGGSWGVIAVLTISGVLFVFAGLAVPVVIRSWLLGRNLD